MPTDARLTLAREIQTLLKQSNRMLVCAESCTAGLVAATLAGIPGASEWLCGSAVVYRNATKTAWLGVSSESLIDPACGDVCRETAIRMAEGVLAVTPEAAVAISITGHLGPNAPQNIDGVIYVGWAERNQRTPEVPTVRCERVELQQPTPVDQDDVTRRLVRQYEATDCVLRYARDCLQSAIAPPIH